QVGSLLEENQGRLAASIPILSRSLADLQELARRDTLQRARDYLHTAGDPVPSWSGTRLLMAGHQPDLFHPGVWIKNFALSGLAKKHGLVPVNLVVDNDLAKTTALRVPVRSREPSAAHVAKVVFDRWQ